MNDIKLYKKEYELFFVIVRIVCFESNKYRQVPNLRPSYSGGK